MSARDATPAKKGTLKQQIDVAVEDVRVAMIENIEAGKAVVDSELRKKAAHYTLLKAKQRLQSLEYELMR